ncbi:HAMP domain-containing protein [Pseudonocardiaceae bacterium YIM PH 21723]|nr:HAMP domain-containing protein [Pseudonocardiaceae bacterium YIM PH 21723]
MIGRWWHRLRVQTRIAVLAAGIGIVLLALFGGLGAVAIGRLAQLSADSALQTQLTTVRDQVAAGKAPQSNDARIGIRLLDTAGTPQDDRPGLELTAGQLDALRRGDVVQRRQDRLLASVITAPDGRPRLVVAVGAFGDYDQTPQRITRILGVAVIIGSMVLVGGAYLAAWAALQPVRALRTAAVGLPAGERLPVSPAKDELRELAESLNALLARRDAAHERLRRFTGDAAHELRSPVSAIRVQADVALAHPGSAPPQEVFAEIAAEAQRLSGLVDDLLLLAKADADRLGTAEPVDLTAAARLAVERATRPVLLQATVPVTVLATPTEVALVLDNLLRNAARYARSVIRITVTPLPGQVRLLVDDDGPGIPEADRERVFDRYYRVDDARGRESGGSGLGLALVDELVRGRGGRVYALPSPDGGARLEVRWLSA